MLNENMMMSKIAVAHCVMYSLSQRFRAEQPTARSHNDIKQGILSALLGGQA